MNKNLSSIHHRLKDDLAFFSETSLKIEDKGGNVIPLVFNDAQWHIHKKLNEQLKKMGRVRALILKGRQQGASTYVGARFYHKAVWNFGKRVFILTHLAKATKDLFQKVYFFYENSESQLKPDLKTSNNNELVFNGLNSRYGVGTAGSSEIGRGGTLQLFHGSEVSVWENPESIRKGIMQSVADIDGTEIILESTANGIGNFFYEACMDAMQGIGDYILIFVPWFWEEIYCH